jgi:hypothetical protein
LLPRPARQGLKEASRSKLARDFAETGSANENPTGFEWRNIDNLLTLPGIAGGDSIIPKTFPMAAPKGLCLGNSRKKMPLGFGTLRAKKNETEAAA